MAYRLDPYHNNEPLHFAKKWTGPTTNTGDMDDGRDVVDITGSPVADGGGGMATMMAANAGMIDNSQMTPYGPGSMVSGNMGMAGPMSAMSNNMGFSGPLLGDPSMFNMMGPMNFNQFGGFYGQMDVSFGPPMDVVKEILTCKTCILYPPPPHLPPRGTRERPPGCRTIFVGGLPENITEDILHDIFENCGIISSIRISKKKFSHIRFETEDCVDRALYLSGYRMKIEDKDDQANTGRLHVDFAQARDDQYEYECKQRTLVREYRHQQRLEEERLRPPSPPPLTRYTEAEAKTMIENLKNEENITQAAELLVGWLERGECNRRTANSFYSLLQCVHSHVRRLVNEKIQYTNDLENAKEQFRQRVEGILRQFEQIKRVFEYSHKQKSWDHFSKAQRKNLETWIKQATETHKLQEAEFLSGRVEAEMDFSDDEDVSTIKKKKMDFNDAVVAAGVVAGQDGERDSSWRTGTVPRTRSSHQTGWSIEGDDDMDNMRDENDSLKCQVEAYKNEVAVLKHENSQNTDDASKDKQVKALQMALQGMQHQFMNYKKQVKQEKWEENKEQREELEQLRQQLTIKRLESKATAEVIAAADRKEREEKMKSEPAKVIISLTDDDDVPATETEKSDNGTEETAITTNVEPSEKPVVKVVEKVAPRQGDIVITERESRLLGLICCFMHVHPNGVTVDYLWSYLYSLCPPIKSSEIDSLLERMTSLFKQDFHGVGANIEKRWYFVGYKNMSLSSI